MLPGSDLSIFTTTLLHLSFVGPKMASLLNGIQSRDIAEISIPKRNQDDQWSWWMKHVRHQA
jgi:hypothetical protein